MLAIRLPEDLELRLNKLAKTTGRTKSFYVRQAIEEKIADLEDIYMAESVLENIKAGKEKTYSIKEVRELLDLED